VTQPSFDLTPLSASERETLARDLSPDERRILLNQGTEAPFCGNLLDNKKTGTYVCKLCSLPLFRSDDKFDSGSGWPSFFRDYAKGHVRQLEDRSHGMVRVEIRCARCDGHLGHVFPDGPQPTGLRYCLNSASMDFVEQGEPLIDRVRR